MGRSRFTWRRLASFFRLFAFPVFSLNGCGTGFLCLWGWFIDHLNGLSICLDPFPDRDHKRIIDFAAGSDTTQIKTARRITARQFSWFGLKCQEPEPDLARSIPSIPPQNKVPVRSFRGYFGNAIVTYSSNSGHMPAIDLGAPQETSRRIRGA